MKANTKKAADFRSRAAAFIAETGTASGPDRASDGFEKCPRRRLPSTHEGSAALTYADTCLFFGAVLFLAMMFRIGVHLPVLSQTRLDNPTLPFQITISLSLIGPLYAIIRHRHGRGVWKLLGWFWPSRVHPVAALLGGIGLGIAVDIIAHATTSTTHVIQFWNLILLDAFLGPIQEEPLFRGCLLPVVAPYNWADYRHRDHGCTLRHAPPDQHIPAMALLRDHGDCVWLDPSQIGFYRNISPDARGIQSDPVLVPVVLDDSGSLNLSRRVLKTRVSPRRVIFAPLEPVIDSL